MNKGLVCSRAEYVVPVAKIRGRFAKALGHRKWLAKRFAVGFTEFSVTWMDAMANRLVELWAGCG